MRYPKNIAFCAEGGRRLPARTFVSRPDTGWIGRGTAFSDATVKRRCTLIVVWYAEQEEPVDHIDRPCARRSGSELVRAPFLDRTGL